MVNPPNKQLGDQAKHQRGKAPDAPEKKSSPLGGYVATRSATAPPRPRDLDEARDRSS